MGAPARAVSTKMGRAYEVDGELLPSVTTVLKQLAAPQLTKWRMEQVAKAAVDLQEWRIMDAETAVEMLMAAGNAFGKRAAAQGTAIHEMIEEGKTPAEVPEKVQPYLLAATKVYEFIGEPVAAERTVVYPSRPSPGWGGYAGTADLFYQAKGGLGVLDWKSKANPGSTAGWSNDALQLAALSACDQFITDDGELMPMEDEVVELTIAAIKSDGTADVRKIDEPHKMAQLQEAFKGLVHVHELMAANPWWMGIWDETNEGVQL